MKQEIENSETSVEYIIWNNGNLFCQLYKIYCQQKFKC